MNIDETENEEEIVGDPTPETNVIALKKENNKIVKDKVLTKEELERLIANEEEFKRLRREVSKALGQIEGFDPTVIISLCYNEQGNFRLFTNAKTTSDIIHSIEYLKYRIFKGE